MGRTTERSSLGIQVQVNVEGVRSVGGRVSGRHPAEKRKADCGFAGVDVWLCVA